MPTHGTPSPPIWVKVSVLRFIHSAMKWQPMPAMARLPSGTLVEVLCGQPEQKYGVRVTGATACIWRRLAAVEPVGLGAQHRRDFGIEVEPQQPLGQRTGERGDAEFLGEGQEALVVLVHLADDARADVVAPVEQLLLDLVLDDLAALLDDEDLFQPDREFAHALRLQRPGHADLVEPQADLGGDFRRHAEFAQRLPDVFVALAGGHDAEARVRRIHGDAVDLVGAGEGDRGKALVVLQPAVLVVAVVGPAQIEAARRHLEIGRNDEGLHLVGEIDLGRGLHRLGDHLHADPAAGVARHRDTQQPHLDHFVDAGGIEIGHQRGDEGVVRLMRHGGGFGAVVVAGQAQHAAVLGRARRIAVAEHVAAAVDAGALAVPDADHAVVIGAGREVELLRAPDRGGREVLVDAGLEFDVVLFEVLAGGEELLVVAAERRAAIAGDEARGVEAAARSRRIWAIGSRTSAWIPVRKTWPEACVYFWSRLIGPWLIPIPPSLQPSCALARPFAAPAVFT